MARGIGGPLTSTGEGRRFGGIGGGSAAAPAFNPVSLSPTLWLPGGAANITQVAGPLVSAMLDRSGASRDFVQATGANQPNVGSINSLACPDFPGGNFRLDSAALGSAIVSPTSYEFWIVANIDTMATGGTLLGDTLQAQCFLRCISTGVQFRVDDGGGLDSTGVITLTPGTTYALGVSYDGVNATLRGAGTTSSVATGSVAALTNAWRIGQDVDGRVVAVFARNTILSAGERTSLTTYLASTYAATL